MQKTLVFILIAASLVLAACGGGATAPSALELYGSCTQTIVVAIPDMDNELVRTYVSPPLESKYRYDSEDEEWELFPVNVEVWEQFYDQIDSDIVKANEMLANLYADDGLVHGVRYGLMNFDPKWPVERVRELDNDACPENDDPNVDLNVYDYWDQKWQVHDLYFGQECDAEARTEYYCTDTTFGKKTNYVKITTPGGSQVSYSYPTKWLNEIIWTAFSQEQEVNFSFNPEFINPDINLDKEAYGESMLQTLTDNSFREVTQLNLVMSDFEGRNELRSVIATAMKIAAVEEGRPVMLTLKGMMSSGQSAVASISAHQDEIRIGGFMILGTGFVSGSGGGGDLQADYSSKFEDIVRGSIYVIP